MPSNYRLHIESLVGKNGVLSVFFLMVKVRSLESVPLSGYFHLCNILLLMCKKFTHPSRASQTLPRTNQERVCSSGFIVHVAEECIVSYNTVNTEILMIHLIWRFSYEHQIAKLKAANISFWRYHACTLRAMRTSEKLCARTQIQNQPSLCISNKRPIVLFGPS